MKFIIEFDGVIAEIAAAHFAAHETAATDVGWSRLDRETFRRLTRTRGQLANILPGAKPAKLEQYHAKFAALIESAHGLGRMTLAPNLHEHLRQIMRFGSCDLVTLGGNGPDRWKLMEQDALADRFKGMHTLDADPRRRPGELAEMGAGTRKTLVVAATDALVRAAGSVELPAVGVAGGTCSVARLRQAGADVVYREFRDFADSLAGGAEDLLRAGVLHASALGGG